MEPFGIIARHGPGNFADLLILKSGKADRTILSASDINALSNGNIGVRSSGVRIDAQHGVGVAAEEIKCSGFFQFRRQSKQLGLYNGIDVRSGNLIEGQLINAGAQHHSEPAGIGDCKQVLVCQGTDNAEGSALRNIQLCRYVR